MSSGDPSPGGGKYRMQAVVSRTGLKAPVIRAWERRYGVPKPSRSESGYRLYSEDDVERLRLLGALREMGEAVGEVAQLSLDVLRDRLTAHRGGVRRAGELTVAIVEPLVSATLRAAPLEGLRIAVEVETLDAYLDQSPRPAIDVLIVGLHQLGSMPVERLQYTFGLGSVRSAVVTFDYARSETLEALAKMGVRLVRTPASTSVLRSVLFGPTELPELALRRQPPEIELPVKAQATQPPPTVFEEGFLAQMLETDASISCGCQSHLSSLIIALGRFEAFSNDCATDHPDEANLHRSVAWGVGHARALLESLLRQLVSESSY